MNPELQTWKIIFLSGFIICEVPILLAMWYGGHRHNLRKLADGEPVIVVPDKNDKPYSWLCGARVFHYRPYFGPMNYLGATASAGMLRRWSIIMATISATVYGWAYFLGDQAFFPTVGFPCFAWRPSTAAT